MPNPEKDTVVKIIEEFRALSPRSLPIAVHFPGQRGVVTSLALFFRAGDFERGSRRLRPLTGIASRRNAVRISRIAAARVAARAGA